jgi:membrane protein
LPIATDLRFPNNPAMACLRDVPRAFKAVSPWKFVVRVWKEMTEDTVFVWAAALAYAWLFAVFPFFIFLLSLIPYLPARVKDQAGEAIQNAISQLPSETANMVWQNVYKVMHQTHTGLLSIGILITVWAASGGMNMTMAALDRVYDVPRARPFWKQRPLAVLLTIVVATLIVLVLVLLPIGTAVTRFVLAHDIPYVTRYISTPMIWTWNIARYLLAVLLLMSTVSITYYFGPSVKQRFHILTPGGVFTIAMWLILGVLFRLYVDKYGRYDKTYGTVAGVAILLLFFYIDALVLLIGAEINSEIDFAIGVPRGSTNFKQPATQDAGAEST